jgi:hypothetical protein
MTRDATTDMIAEAVTRCLDQGEDLKLRTVHYTVHTFFSMTRPLPTATVRSRPRLYDFGGEGLRHDCLNLVASAHSSISLSGFDDQVDLALPLGWVILDS